jgi:Flp pilus assembly protein TadG
MAPRRERGAALVLVIIGMLALLAMAGLAIDTAHVLLNKSRLQSALDAAALAAAKSLSQSTDTTVADKAAGDVFTLNYNLGKYPELQSAVTGGLTLTTQYSSTLIPFNAGTAPALFVRASVARFTTQMSLISVLGITSMNVAGSAVAGPSPPLSTACNIVPVFVCADTTVGTAPLFNFKVGQVLGLNLSAGSTSTIGPGNYGLLSIGGPGGNIVQNNLAGDYANCASVNGTEPTQPGVQTGPVSQGINTRFNDYKGGLSSTQYPPDPINSAAHQTSLTQDATTGDVMQGATDISTITPAANQAAALTFNYSNYNTASYDSTVPPAVPKRRVLAAPLGDCTGLANGRNTVTVKGFACVFLLQALGPGAKNNTFFAQITSGCDANGVPGAGGGGGPTTGPFRIQLYKSAASPDS